MLVVAYRTYTLVAHHQLSLVAFCYLLINVAIDHQYTRWKEEK